MKDVSDGLSNSSLTDTGDSRLRAALEYALKGWPVFPCHGVVQTADGFKCTCGNTECVHPGKHPRTPHGFKDATADADSIRQWWTKWPEANIGIATGRDSGLVVVDVDSKVGKIGGQTLADLQAQHPVGWETRRVRTGSGGLHYYFEYPADAEQLTSKTHAFGRDVDSRADGGYIIAPPSRHSSGEHYRWLDDTVPLAPLPGFLREKIEPAPRGAAPPQPRTPPQDRDRFLIEDALKVLPADDYDLWVNIGMALHHTGDAGGFKLWDAWSQASAKYRPEEIAAKWDSFAHPPDQPVTLGTLFHRAEEHGWKRLQAEQAWQNQEVARLGAFLDNILEGVRENSERVYQDDVIAALRELRRLKPNDYVIHRSRLKTAQPGISVGRLDELTEPPARPRSAESSTDPTFRLENDGLYYLPQDEDGHPLPKVRLSGRLAVLSMSRDNRGNEWGRVLQFSDQDGRERLWAMPAELLYGRGEALCGQLAAKGVYVSTHAPHQKLLIGYLGQQTPSDRVRCVDKIGWRDRLFVFPDRTVGESVEQVVFQSAVLDDTFKSPFREAGTLAEWRTEIAALCAGNSRLAFAVSCAFAALLLPWTGDTSGGFHLVGTSSCGKTTALLAAGSVFGDHDFVTTWRATDNALESIAKQRNHALLLLDELAEVDPRVVGATTYMLANEQGKGRANRSGDARPRANWRLLFLSTGEIGLAEHMRQVGTPARAGQEIRLINLPADAGRKLGLFENLHGLAGGGALADAVRDRTARHHGTAAGAFIEGVIARFEEVERLGDTVNRATADLTPPGADGQVQRAARRFALVAVAGELATDLGITGWLPGEAFGAAQTCLRAWLADRGGIDNQERSAILRQVRQFFELHGESRFSKMEPSASEHDAVIRTNQRAGFSRRQGDGEDRWTQFLALSEVFAKEICKGFRSREVARLLAEEGWLLPDEKTGKSSRRESLPGLGQTRCYVFTRKLMEDDLCD